MEQDDLLTRLRLLNDKASFNRCCGFEVVAAQPGNATIAMAWREEMGQYSNFLHAGIVSALIDTACGFAAFSLGGNVLASHCSVNFLRPAVGLRFVAQARVVKPGKSQFFTACDLYAQNGTEEKLVATGETLLLVVNDGHVT